MMTRGRTGIVQGANIAAISVLSIGVIGFFSMTGCQSTNGGYQSANTATFADKESNANEVAPIRTQIAAQYLSDNKLDAAYRQLEKALAANKHYAPAYDMMGVLLQQEGSRRNINKAEQYFDQAIELDPSFMQARNNYGVYLSQVGRYHEAIVQFELAGSALGYEGRIGALENLGRTATKVENWPLASQAFVKVLESSRPNNRQARMTATIELIDILMNNNKVSQARALYNEMLAETGDMANKMPRTLLQGIQLAHEQQNLSLQEKLSRQLLADFSLSQEAKKLEVWIRNPEASWK